MHIRRVASTQSSLGTDLLWNRAISRTMVVGVHQVGCVHPALNSVPDLNAL